VCVCVPRFIESGVIITSMRGCCRTSLNHPFWDLYRCRKLYTIITLHTHTHTHTLTWKYIYYYIRKRYSNVNNDILFRFWVLTVLYDEKNLKQPYSSCCCMPVYSGVEKWIFLFCLFIFWMTYTWILNNIIRIIIEVIIIIIIKYHIQMKSVLYYNFSLNPVPAQPSGTHTSI